MDVSIYRLRTRDVLTLCVLSLLLLGILLVVVGVQFLSLGLIGEMLTSHHQEKAHTSAAKPAYVRDVLR